MVTDRAAVGTTVAATVLGVKPFHFETVVAEWEGGPLIFHSPKQIVVTAPIKLETEETLWLGEVVNCHPDGHLWRTTLCVKHTLRRLPELLNLAARFE